jgi:FdhD protein
LRRWHNAVHKTAGWVLLNGRLPLAGGVLLVSGRASSELVRPGTSAVPALVHDRARLL